MNLLQLRRLGTLFLKLIATAVFTVGVLVAGAIWLVPRFTAIRTLTVLTGSMTPTIPQGSVVFTRPTDANVLDVGDVITFHAQFREDALVTHRVARVVRDPNNELSFRTKGDANKADDPYPTSAARVVGKVVFHLPYVGYLSEWSRTPRGAVLFFGLPLMVLVGSSLQTLLAELMRHKNRPHTRGAPGRGDSVRSDATGLPTLGGALSRRETPAKGGYLADGAPIDLAPGDVHGAPDRSEPCRVWPQVAVVRVEPTTLAGALQLPMLMERAGARTLSTSSHDILIHVAGASLEIDELVSSLRAVGRVESTRGSVGTDPAARGLPIAGSPRQARRWIRSMARRRGKPAHA